MFSFTIEGLWNIGVVQTVILAFYKKFTCSHERHLLIEDSPKAPVFSRLRAFLTMIFQSTLSDSPLLNIYAAHSDKNLWNHGEVYGLIQKVGLDHYMVPSLTRGEKKSVRISSKLLEFPFTQMSLPMHLFSKLLSLTSRTQGNLKQM